MRILTIVALTAVGISLAYGDDAVQLTFDPADDHYASWSPDGNTIAFTSERTTGGDVYTIPVTGGTATRITDHSSADLQPEWSPDGTIIVYYSNYYQELFKIPSTGGTPTRFTYNSVVDYSPSWSSDDTKIACHGYYVKGGANSQIDNDIF